MFDNGDNDNGNLIRLQYSFDKSIKTFNEEKNDGDVICKSHTAHEYSVSTINSIENALLRQQLTI